MNEDSHLGTAEPATPQERAASRRERGGGDGVPDREHRDRLEHARHHARLRLVSAIFGVRERATARHRNLVAPDWFTDAAAGGAGGDGAADGDVGAVAHEDAAPALPDAGAAAGDVHQAGADDDPVPAGHAQHPPDVVAVRRRGRWIVRRANHHPGGDAA